MRYRFSACVAQRKQQKNDDEFDEKGKKPTKMHHFRWTDGNLSSACFLAELRGPRIITYSI